MGATIEKCALCPKDAKPVVIRGYIETSPDVWEGVCDYHKKNPTAKVERSVHAPKIPGVKSDKVEMDAWFAKMLKEQPKYSENDPTMEIRIPDPYPLKSSVCHIVPKGLVPSVKSHPLNRWYGNLDEHNYYDDKFHTDAALMPVARLCIERFAVFMHLIPPSEMKHVAQWLINGAVQYQCQQQAEKNKARTARGLDNRTPVKKSKPRTK